MEKVRRGQAGGRCAIAEQLCWLLYLLHRRHHAASAGEGRPAVGRRGEEGKIPQVMLDQAPTPNDSEPLASCVQHNVRYNLMAISRLNEPYPYGNP